jgi:hypothetical protein
MVRADTPVRLASCPMVNISPLVLMQTTVHLPAAGSSSCFCRRQAAGSAMMTIDPSSVAMNMDAVVLARATHL